MMRRLVIPLIAALAFAPQVSRGQISPGQLSKAHSGLEGITNCSQCHESGQEISGDKCMACHDEIKKEIDIKRGFHFASSESRCVGCHKEHLGRDAKIYQFDREHFDHLKTGFRLTGKHGSLKCEQCHADKFITSAEVKKVQKEHPHSTFLGLDPACASCHADRHKATVSNDCQACHSTNGWRPAEAFDHGKAKFPLAGKHKPIECTKCHDGMANKGPADPILFGTKNFTDCKSCHASPHGTKFADKPCSSCHNVEGWKAVSGIDHTGTRFALIGKHNSVACEKCHLGLPAKKGQPVDLKTKDFGDCKPCHTSPHSPTFSDAQCKTCHNPTSWSSRTSASFDHNLTKYKLTGRHVAVQCEKCHRPTPQKTPFAQRFFLTSGRCIDCHADYHKGQISGKQGSDCRLCHTEQAFRPSLFTVAKHAETRFPLGGAHAAVPCSDCHKKGGQADPVFRFNSLLCETCHADKHNGAFKKFTAEQSCGKCHTTQDWKIVVFDHSTTRFVVTGKHLVVKCTDCHKEEIVAGVKTVKYQGAPAECESCHKDVHQGQFIQEGQTKCARCHTPMAWRTLAFNHETQSVFQLTGAHKNVPCRSCHKEEKIGDRLLMRFKPLPTKCESCHQGVVK